MMQNSQQVQVQFKNIHKQPITGISAANLTQFLTISEDFTMRLFDLRLNSSIKIFQMDQVESDCQIGNCLLGQQYAYGVRGTQILAYDLRMGIINKDITMQSNECEHEINSISFDSSQQLICANYDNGDTRIFNEQLQMMHVLAGGHKNICFTGDFIQDNEYGQLCLTAGFDCQIILWKYEQGQQQGQIVKTTDLNKIHPQYSGISVTPPIIYSAVCKGQDVLISTETGQVYNFNVAQLKKKKNKKAPEPTYVIDGHLNKVMRSIFFNDLVVTVSNDQTFGLWQQGVSILRVKIPHKPNWIEGIGNNTLLVADVSNQLSIYSF